MAVSNVGAWLALRGPGVVLLDVDFEQPSLLGYFRPNDQHTMSGASAGFRDLLAAYRAAASTPMVGDEPLALPDVRDYLVQTGWCSRTAGAGQSFRHSGFGDARKMASLPTDGPMPPGQPLQSHPTPAGGWLQPTGQLQDRRGGRSSRFATRSSGILTAPSKTLCGQASPFYFRGHEEEGIDRQLPEPGPPVSV
jgi:hypothetical protein